VSALEASGTLTTIDNSGAAARGVMAKVFARDMDAVRLFQVQVC
jgi:hypothetical protein